MVWILLRTWELVSLLPDLGCTELRLRRLQQVEMLMGTRVQPGLGARWVSLLSHSPVALGSSLLLPLTEVFMWEISTFCSLKNQQHRASTLLALVYKPLWVFRGHFPHPIVLVSIPSTWEAGEHQLHT